MKTLYLRNVPDDVAASLTRLADGEGMSVNAFAVRELGRVARRAENAQLLAGLTDHAIGTDAILAALDRERDAR